MKRIAACLCLALPIVACATSPALEGERLISPGGACEVEVTISGMGGAKGIYLKAGSKAKLIAKDVTAALWRTSTTLIFSGSSIYGLPGLFEFDCTTGKSRTVVPATNKSQAYPEGADYFELVSVDSKKDEACYYYARDVDSADFATLRRPNNLKCASLRK